MNERAAQEEPGQAPASQPDARSFAAVNSDTQLARRRLVCLLLSFALVYHAKSSIFSTFFSFSHLVC